MTFGRERHDSLEHDDDTFEDEPSRSIFSATWFRALLVFIALAVIAVVAMPYALEWANPPAKTRGIAKSTRTEAPTSPSPPVSGPVPVAVVPKPTPSTTATPDTTSSSSGTTTEPRVVPSVPGPAETSTPGRRAQEPARAADGSRAPATTPGTTLPPASTPPPVPQGSTPSPDTTLAQGSTPSQASPPPSGAPSPTTMPPPRAPLAQGAAPSTGAVGATEPSKAMEPAGSTENPRAAQPPKRVDVARAPDASTREATRPPASGPYWIQVGAFRDPDTARRMVEKLRDQQFPVADPEKMVSGVAAAAPVAAPTPTPAAGPDRYDVFVSGIAANDLNTRIESRSLTADPVAGGAVVKPSLPLADAVALAKQLSGDGLRVQVRRASGSAHATAPAAATEPQTLYRVRVGSYPDRSAAVAALHDLEAKGYKPFLARGAQ